MADSQLRMSVIGDGGWGTTLAIHLARKGYDTTLWGAFPEYVDEVRRRRENYKFLPFVRIPDQVHLTSDLREAAEGVEVLVVAVPSRFLRKVMESLVELKLDLPPIVSLSKGIEHGTLLRMSEVITDVFGERCPPVCVLSGPSIAREVAQGLPTTVVLAHPDVEVATPIQELFMSETFRVYVGTDVVGVELGGALKNVVAIACGIADGIGFKANTKAALITRGLAEMARLGDAMGAEAKTFSGLSGLGDLVTTCISEHSRNRGIGEDIGRGRKLSEIMSGMEMVAEGVETVKAAHELQERYQVDMPITDQVYAILYEGSDPQQGVLELLKRIPHEE